MNKLYELANKSSEKRFKHFQEGVDKEINKIAYEEGFVTGANMVQKAMLEQLDRLLTFHKVDDYLSVREQIIEMIYNLEELTNKNTGELKQ
jgi:arginyl-tRNA--protein-N-Asp/Glu arginylyltransferase